MHDGQGAPQAGPVGEGQDGGQLGGVQRPVPWQHQVWTWNEHDKNQGDKFIRFYVA